MKTNIQTHGLMTITSIHIRLKVVVFAEFAEWVKWLKRTVLCHYFFYLFFCKTIDRKVLFISHIYKHICVYSLLGFSFWIRAIILRWCCLLFTGFHGCNEDRLIQLNHSFTFVKKPTKHHLGIQQWKRGFDF